MVPTRINKANRPIRPLLHREIGLETEYGVSVRLPADQCEPPSRREVFHAVCKSLASDVPTAKARHNAFQVFLATGGAISLESSFHQLDDAGGLIEGSTPECRSPRNLLACQRVQDRLFSDAVTRCPLPVSIRLLKNSRDANGHVYGCQENYSADVARGFGLLMFRVCLIALIPFSLLYAAVCWSLMLLVGGVLVVGCFFKREAADSECSGRIDNFIPNWCLSAALSIMQWSLYPLGIALGRSVMASRSSVNVNGDIVFNFQNSLVGGGRPRWQRQIPCFRQSFGYRLLDLRRWLKSRSTDLRFRTLVAILGHEASFSPRIYLQLFQRKQRLQIGLSDSNVADNAEYLKVAATSLVLDMIEAGHTSGLPRIKKPIQALHQLSADWTLISRVATDLGPMTGLEIQRAYLNRCSLFVRSRTDEVPAEVWQILELWEQMLDAAQAIRDTPVDYHSALAKIDWASKKWLMDQMGCGASLISQKKVDLKYHELSEEGYFCRLSEVIACQQIARIEEINAAMRIPRPIHRPHDVAI
ncbi:MAG: proteasome accessory factor PafA2 family protein [Pirellulaceae bacterium]